MLKKLAKRIEKELEQAQDYCEQAFITKMKSSTTANLFATLASEEIEHAEKLIQEGQRLVNTKHTDLYAAKDTNDTDDMWHIKCAAIWEWETRTSMSRISELRYKISMYRGM